MIQPNFIAELVLGYLSDEGLAKTCEAFQGECLLLRDSNSGSSPKLDHSLKAIIEEYLSIRDTVNKRDTTGNPQLLSLWKKFDVLVGQLKYATVGKSSPVKVTQSVRTKRMNQAAGAGVGTGTTNSGSHKVCQNPPHTWQPVRLSSKKKTQQLLPLRTISTERGTFQQVIDPALAGLNNVMLPIPPFPFIALNQQSSNIFTTQSVIGQLPCLSRTANSSALVQVNGVAPTNTIHSLTGHVPYLYGQPHNTGSSGSDSAGRMAPSIVTWQPLFGQTAPLRGQLQATASGSSSFQQGNSLPISNVTQPNTVQSTHCSGPLSVAASDPGLSSPALVSVVNGSCTSSPINVEEVSPYGSPSPSSTAVEEKDPADDYVCEVLDEGSAQGGMGSGDSGVMSFNGVEEMHSVVQDINLTQLSLGSPRRKCNQPRKRGPFSPAKPVDVNNLVLPTSEMHRDNESSSLTENTVPYFLDTLLNEPLLQEKLAENINKIVTGSKQDLSSHEESTAVSPSGSCQITHAPVNDLLSLMEADPAFDSLFSFFGEDALEVIPSFNEPCDMSSVQTSETNPANEMAASTVASTTDPESTATSVVTDALLLLAASPSAVNPLNRSQTEELSRNTLRPISALQSPSTVPMATSRGNPPAGVWNAQNPTNLPHMAHVRTLDFSVGGQGETKMKKARGRKKGSRNVKTSMSERKKLKSKAAQESRVVCEAAPSVPAPQPFLRIDPNSSCDFPKTATVVLQALAKNHLSVTAGASADDRSGETVVESSTGLSNQENRSTTNISESSNSNTRTPHSSCTGAILDRRDKCVPVSSMGFDLSTQTAQGTLLLSGKGNESGPSCSSTTISSSQTSPSSRISPSTVTSAETSLGALDGDLTCSKRASSNATASAQQPLSRCVNVRNNGALKAGSNQGTSSLVTSSVSPETISNGDSSNCQELSSLSDTRNDNSRAFLSEENRRRESATHGVFPRNVDARISGNVDVSSSGRDVNDAARDAIRDCPSDSSRAVLSEDNRHRMATRDSPSESNDRGRKRQSKPYTTQKAKKARGINGTKKSKNKKDKMVSFPADLDVDKFLSALHYDDK